MGLFGRPKKVRDPVCHMVVEVGNAAASAEHEGTTYHFCSAGCKTKFEAEPAKYLGA